MRICERTRKAYKGGVKGDYRPGGGLGGLDGRGESWEEGGTDKEESLQTGGSLAKGLRIEETLIES